MAQEAQGVTRQEGSSGMIIGRVLLGIIVIIVGVVEWVAKVSVIHGVAILTGIVGLAIVFLGGEAYYTTRGTRGVRGG